MPPPGLGTSTISGPLPEGHAAVVPAQHIVVGASGSTQPRGDPPLELHVPLLLAPVIVSPCTSVGAAQPPVLANVGVPQPASA